MTTGAYITDFEYDWKKHKVPPKQIQSADPLQFMLLDAVDQSKLPGAALDLPDAERDQNNEGGERESREPQVRTRSRSQAARFAIAGVHEIAHFIPVIS